MPAFAHHALDAKTILSGAAGTGVLLGLLLAASIPTEMRAPPEPAWRQHLPTAAAQPAFVAVGSAPEDPFAHAPTAALEYRLQRDIYAELREAEFRRAQDRALQIPRAQVPRADLPVPLFASAPPDEPAAPPSPEPDTGPSEDPGGTPPASRSDSGQPNP